MTTEQLEIAIQEGMERLYCARYCGTLQVKELRDCICLGCCTSTDGDVVGYEFMLGLNVEEKPIRIAFHGTAEQFLIYILKELKIRQLNIAKYFDGFMTDHICNVPKKCC